MQLFQHFCAFALMGQRSLGYGIDERWGGAFEILWLTPERFIHVDDALYFTAEIRTRDDGKLRLGTVQLQFVKHIDDCTWVFTISPRNAAASFFAPALDTERPHPTEVQGSARSISAALISPETFKEGGLAYQVDRPKSDTNAFTVQCKNTLVCIRSDIPYWIALVLSCAEQLGHHKDQFDLFQLEKDLYGCLNQGVPW